MKPGAPGIFVLIASFVALHVWSGAPEAGTQVMIATAIGGTAYILMAVAIFLSTRPSFLESAFGGLDRMYQAHKMSGVSAGLLVLVHFFLAPKELPPGVDAALQSMTPSAPLGMISLILLAISIALTLNRKIAYSKWRVMHKAMGVVFVLVTAHFFLAPEVFLPKQASSFVLLAAGAVGILSYLANLVGLTRRGAHDFSIQAINHLERATEVVFAPVKDMFSFIPGQFVIVEMEDKAFAEPHPFTISSAPHENQLRLTVKVLGDWTRKVREDLAPGGKVKVHGPYGRFDTSKAGKRQMWIAGGVGVTPFLSNIRAMQKDDPREVGLIYAVRENAEALFLDELRNREAEIANLRMVVLESNNGEFARVDKMRERLPKNLENYEFFLCGPKPMVSSLRKDLKAAGVPAGSIHSEAFEFR